MKKLYTLLVVVLVGFVGKAQIITIPDANFKAKLLSVGVDTNNDGDIDQNEANQVQDLDVSNSNISDISGINYFHSLSNLNCSNNQLTDLDVSGLINLQSLSCFSNQLTNLDVSGLMYLGALDCHTNGISNLNVAGLYNLYYINCSGNYLQSIDLSGLTGLYNFVCSNNQLQSINVSGLTGLQYLFCSNNQLSNLNVSALTGLLELNCSNNQIPSLNVTGLIQLNRLDYANNPNLTVNLSGLNHLDYLRCSGTNLTSLDTSVLTTITSLECSSNQLTTLDTSNLTNINHIECSNNPLTAINTTNLVNLQSLRCNNTAIQTLDVSHCSQLYSLSCENISSLVSLFIKNGSNEVYGIILNGNSNLQYICADDSQVDSIQDYVNNIGLNCHVNSYCSFVPGGTFYSIKGNNRFDEDNNGCSVADLNYPNLKLSFTDGTNTGNLIPDTSGAYQFDVQAGTQTFTPTLENPAYFNISPTSSSVTFPTTTSPFIQDFCITANGVHNDLEVALSPILRARPGFDATYKIIYKNKGTVTQSGTVNLAFDDSRLDFVSAVPTTSSQTTNSLSWSFSNLLPFETREISVTLNVNSPTETPAVNNGDVLNYVVTIVGAADETPSDNTSTLNQAVVNALDPNDKTCVEGTTISPSMIGQYVHYVIGFENDGTANAQNIVVKDMIDTAKFDISTLIPLSGSASYTTRITNTNKVEFVFQNINLPFAAGTNTGYVAFKIKTMPTLLVGNTFSNSANIYFDYNAPIVTNTATTTIATLGTEDFDFGSLFTLSPVPAKNSLTISTKQDVMMRSVSIYNTLGQLVQVNTNPNETIDVSGLQSGSYFIRISSDKGSASGKFIKE